MWWQLRQVSYQARGPHPHHLITTASAILMAIAGSACANGVGSARGNMTGIQSAEIARSSRGDYKSRIRGEQHRHRRYRAHAERRSYGTLLRCGGVPMKTPV